ncbi:hypothetical protein ElyMa_003174500 [Elysia marginata]|uniref:Uncharacterized protein n=1 Tax=Elysia marginata TaxID=1093978 RepID=A0AAV4J0D8_9GAST|nr:hypothetical protein ElyMa_003174500 [Elysia marginata]
MVCWRWLSRWLSVKGQGENGVEKFVIRSQAFVELMLGGEEKRWEWGMSPDQQVADAKYYCRVEDGDSGEDNYDHDDDDDDDDFDDDDDNNDDDFDDNGDGAVILMLVVML